MQKKLGLLLGLALGATALLPLAGSPAGASTVNGPINAQVPAGTPGNYYCFGAKATITDATKTFRWIHPNGDGGSTTPYKEYGGPQVRTDITGLVTATYNVYYGTPDAVIIGTSGRDWIEGVGKTKVCSLDGDDVVVVDARGSKPGWVNVDGGRGNDEIFGINTGAWNTGVSIHSYGGPGNDILGGGFGNDYLDAGAGGNILNGFDGTDQCFAGDHPNFVPNDQSPANWTSTLGHADMRTPDPVSFNCETNAKGRAWTNHAMFFAPAPVTTTTTR